MKIEKTCKTLAFVGAAVVSLLAAGADVWRAELLIPEPQPVRTRFGGRVGAKFDALVRERCLSENAKGRFYEETVNAFRTHYDDLAKPGNGYWQGEYWGKNMLALIAGAWKLSLQTPDGKVETKVSDLATAADDGGYDAFSVWF